MRPRKVLWSVLRQLRDDEGITGGECPPTKSPPGKNKDHETSSLFSGRELMGAGPARQKNME